MAEGDANALRMLACIVLGYIFFYAGFHWFEANVPDSQRWRVIGSPLITLASAYSALSFYRFMDRKKA